MQPFASTRSDGISNKRNLNEVLPMLATRIWFGLTSERAVLFGRDGVFAGDESAQLCEIVVWTRDHVDGDNLADRGCRGGAGFHGGFHRRDFATDYNADITRADFFPADEFNIGGLQHRVSCFEPVSYTHLTLPTSDLV